jgi:GrpB-like predicted nucleotidyltransferase (UPF0157 family)
MNDPILVAPYDPQWALTFERDRAQLQAALRDLNVQIEHIGSTSVVGLAAKPIIDIMIVTQNEADAIRCITPIVRLDFECRGEAEIPGRLFFRRTNPRTHNLHLYTTPANPEVERHLLFRNYLRAHPEAVQQYAELKYALAEKYRNDLEAYTESKTEFVRGIEASARSESQHRVGR